MLKNLVHKNGLVQKGIDIHGDSDEELVVEEGDPIRLGARQERLEQQIRGYESGVNAR